MTKTKTKTRIHCGLKTVSSRSRRRYVVYIERVAWRHLELLGCCETLLDAIGHVTREDEKPWRAA